MSNPDEETAVNQFWQGGKYFGIAVMLVTLPGLPMFAHWTVRRIYREVRDGVQERHIITNMLMKGLLKDMSMKYFR
jgi:hypothetical protein